MTLPSELAFHLTISSKRVYLRCIKDGYLEFSGSVFDQGAKFAVEQAKCGGDLVHIRCCANNKYWVRSSASTYSIVATAKDAIEDKTAWNCTLFKPTVYSKSVGSVMFEHVQIRHPVCLMTKTNQLTVDPQNFNTISLGVVDYESLVIFPSSVAFLGNNDQYLRDDPTGVFNGLKFKEHDLGSKSVQHEVIPNIDGDICIKNTYLGKFWYKARSPVMFKDAILANAENGSEVLSLFRPIKVVGDSGETLIALRSLANNNFLQPDIHVGSGWLCASASSLTKETRLRVIEPILESTVSKVEYHLSNARIYGQTLIVMSTQSADNATDTSDTMTLGFEYNDTTTRTFTHSATVTAGVKTTFTTGIPFIAEGKIEVSLEGSYTHEWGKAVTESMTNQSQYTATVPPRTRVIVSFVATSGKCDIPFTYTRTDVLTDGRRVTRTLADGVFNGVNNYNFHYEVKQEPLPPSQWK